MIHDQLRDWTRIEIERHPSPSEAVIESQSAKLAGESTLSGRLCVKSAAMVSQSVGFDAGKKIKGRKRFLTVDTLGLILRVLVTSASMGERERGKQVLQRVKQYPHQTSRLTTLWVDGGNDYEPFMQWVMNFCRCPSAGGITPTTNQGQRQCSKNVGLSSALLVGSWGVGGWSTDVEFLPETSETFIYLAMIRIMVRRLAENFTPQNFSNNLLDSPLLKSEL